MFALQNVGLRHLCLVPQIDGGHGAGFIALAFFHRTDEQIETFADGAVECVAPTRPQVNPL